MKREIKNIIPLNLDGAPIKLPKYDSDGRPVLDDDGNSVLYVGKLSECLKLMIKLFPRESMSMENVIQGNRLYGILEKSTDGVAVDTITVKDGSYNWVIKQLKDPKVGQKMFGMNVLSVLRAWQGEIEEEPEPEDKEE